MCCNPSFGVIPDQLAHQMMSAFAHAIVANASFPNDANNVGAIWINFDAGLAVMTDGQVHNLTALRNRSASSLLFLHCTCQESFLLVFQSIAI